MNDYTGSEPTRGTGSILKYIHFTRPRAYAYIFQHNPLVTNGVILLINQEANQPINKPAS